LEVWLKWESACLAKCETLYSNLSMHPTYKKKEKKRKEKAHLEEKDE
jgi:hypothetical protein